MTTTTISDNQATFDSNAVLEEIDLLLDEVEVSAQHNDSLMENLQISGKKPALRDSVPTWAVITGLLGLGACVGLGFAGLVL